MEVVKTRLQLQGELGAATGTTYGNIFGSAIKIAKSEGIVALQKGLGPAYVYQFFMNGTRFAVYEPVKQFFHRIINAPGNSSKSTASANTYFSLVFAGALSGAAGAFVASPIFLVKTVLFGHQHEYIQRGLFPSLWTIFKEEGVKGLWRGSNTAMLRTAVGSSAQLSTYDQTKALLLSSGYFGSSTFQLHLTSSFISSFFVALAMNPFDVAVTRMYNQKTAKGSVQGSLYKSGWDCIVKSVKAEGFKALYKGYWAHYWRIGPHTIFTFIFYEQFKAIANR